MENTNNTKELIIASAKEQFYLNGYKDTTIADIFSSIDVPVGVFTYYFKTKDMLVTEIYNEFFNKIDEQIISCFEYLREKYFLKQAVLSKIFYNIILSDKKNSYFFYQYMQKTFFVGFDCIVINIFRNYIKEFNLVVSEEEFQTALTLDTGARKAFFMDYFLHRRQMHPYAISDIIEATFPLLMRIDKDIVDSILYKSIKITKSIDYSDIVFLI